MPKTRIVDANVILRYLLQDHEELSVQAAGFIDDPQMLMVPNEVVCEVVYVLSKVYQVPRSEIASTLGAFVRRPNLQWENREVAQLAIETFGLRSLDIVDSFLFARHRLDGVEVLTFDKALRKLC